MKKIILILFLFCLLYACYYIYNVTEEHKLDIVLIGDNIADNPYYKDIDNVGIINRDFVNRDYRLRDMVNILKYNQELDVNDKTESIHKLLMDSDIVIISLGMNDIYYKLNDNTREIYTYLNDMVNNYQEILKEIKRYDYQKVYILGYYDIDNRYSDVFSYVNYKLKQVTKEYGYEYLDLHKILYNREDLYQKKDNFYLNDKGYKEIYKIIVENLKKY